MDGAKTYPEEREDSRKESQRELGNKSLKDLHKQHGRLLNSKHRAQKRRSCSIKTAINHTENEDELNNIYVVTYQASRVETLQGPQRKYVKTHYSLGTFSNFLFICHVSFPISRNLAGYHRQSPQKESYCASSSQFLLCFKTWSANSFFPRKGDLPKGQESRQESP